MKMIAKIEALRDKYSAPSIETLEETYKRSLFGLKRLDSEQECRYSEHFARIEEFKTNNSKLKKNLAQEERKLSSMLTELENHNEVLKKLEYEKSKLITENRLAECENDKIKTKCAMPNKKDENLLENGRRKCDYYKNLTGIRWDYLLKDCTKGYITNKHNYIHPFLFDLDDPKLEEKLWEEIMRSTVMTTAKEITGNE